MFLRTTYNHIFFWYVTSVLFLTDRNNVNMKQTSSLACASAGDARPPIRFQGHAAAGQCPLPDVAPACALAADVSPQLRPREARSHPPLFVSGSAVRPSEDGVDATTAPTS